MEYNDIVTAITTGKIPNGRTLAPDHAVENLSHLTAADAMAIAVYLKNDTAHQKRSHWTLRTQPKT